MKVFARHRYVRVVSALLITISAALVPAASAGLHPERPRAVTTPELGRPLRSQSVGGVASDGDGYLVVWRDQRTGSGDIYAATFDASGEPRRGPFLVAGGRREQRDPVVAFDGSNYLLAWSDLRGVPAWSEDVPDIYAARVRTDGRVLDPGGFPVSEARGAQSVTAIASTGETSFVVWTDTRVSTETHHDAAVFGARVSRAGRVLDPRGVKVAQTPGWEDDAAVAGSRDGFVVVWTSFDGAERITAAVRVTSGGEVLDRDPLTVTTEPSESAAVASDGRTFVVTWVARGEDPVDERVVRAAGVEWDGSVGMPVELGRGEPFGTGVSFDGSNFLVTWVTGDVDGHEVVGRHVTADAAPVEREPFALGGGWVYRPEIAVIPGGGLMAWSESGPEGPAGYVRPLSSDGHPSGTGRLLSPGYGSQSQPTAASSGDDSLFVFRDSRVPGVVMARTARSGERLDGAGIVLHEGGRTPSVAFDGENYLVVWVEDPDFVGDRFDTDVWGSRLDRNAQPLGRPFQITDAAGSQTAPSVAAGSDGFMVVWEDGRLHVDGDGEGSDIFGARVARDGTVIDPDGVLVAGPGSETVRGEPDVAASPDGYLVAWHDAAGVEATMVSADGSVLDRGFDLGPGLYPSVASGGGRFLVVWQARSRVIAAARFLGAGEPLGKPWTLSRSPAPASHAQATFDGRRFTVVWLGSRSRDGVPTRSALLGLWVRLPGRRQKALRVSAWRPLSEPVATSVAEGVVTVGAVQQIGGLEPYPLGRLRSWTVRAD